MKAGIAMSVLCLALCGCVFRAEPLPPPGVVVPPGVVYVAPAYASPGPGYVWRHHPEHGWGWYHAEHGWHRGWR